MKENHTYHPHEEQRYGGDEANNYVRKEEKLSQSMIQHSKCAPRIKPDEESQHRTYGYWHNDEQSYDAARRLVSLLEVNTEQKRQ